MPRAKIIGSRAPNRRLSGRQLPTEQPEKCFGRQRDEPGGVIASMRNNPWFTTAIAFGLRAGIDQVEFLNSFNFEVQPAQGIANDIRTVGTA